MSPYQGSDSSLESTAEHGRATAFPFLCNLSRGMGEQFQRPSGNAGRCVTACTTGVSNSWRCAVCAELSCGLGWAMGPWARGRYKGGCMRGNRAQPAVVRSGTGAGHRGCQTNGSRRSESSGLERARACMSTSTVAHSILGWLPARPCLIHSHCASVHACLSCPTAAPPHASQLPVAFWRLGRWAEHRTQHSPTCSPTSPPHTEDTAQLIGRLKQLEWRRHPLG